MNERIMYVLRFSSKFVFGKKATTTTRIVTDFYLIVNSS